jgi:formylglycine-generating enzyme required for sulfatase activity
MAQIENTVFISYRRKDISWALAVYQYLTSQKYDVFFDFSSLSSGDFEQVIVSNIKARAHFVLILTPTALDRCNEPGDWLRREIEIAVDEKRNIIPLFFDGFNFGAPSIAEKLTGKLGAINRYNGLDIPSGYFMEAMERLSSRYLNVPLNAVIHPVSTEVRKVVKEEKVAVNKALIQQWEDIKELIKPAEEKRAESPFPSGRGVRGEGKSPNLRLYGISAGILLIATLGIFGINLLNRNAVGTEPPSSTPTNREVVATKSTPAPTRTISTETATVAQFTPTSEFRIGSIMISPKDDMVMVYIPAGEFTMGSEGGDPDEQPVHTVTLPPFWIDQTEVTNAMFAKFVEETDYITDAERAGRSSVYDDGSWKQIDGVDWLHPLNPSSGISDSMDHPVVHVSWNDADTYCSWADLRLPTEAEWEKAASWDDIIKKKNIFPWGNNFIGYLLNFCDKNCSYTWADKNSDDGYEITAPVGTYPDGASPSGVLDMAGNVWEIVNDWYGENYYKNPVSSNPQGPDVGTSRVLRGGSWINIVNKMRMTERGVIIPGDSYIDTGFRCAFSASE